MERSDSLLITWYECRFWVGKSSVGGLETIDIDLLTCLGVVDAVTR